jgi:hypothetical protein
MTCPSCGTEHRAGRTICVECGAALAFKSGRQGPPTCGPLSLVNVTRVSAARGRATRQPSDRYALRASSRAQEGKMPRMTVPRPAMTSVASR